MPSVGSTEVRLLVWTPDLIASYWRAVYAHNLPQSRHDRAIARHVVSILTARVPPPQRVLLLCDRDPVWAETLVFAGYEVCRVDSGPLLREMGPNFAADPRWYGTAIGLPAAWADLVMVPGILPCITAQEIPPLFALVRSALKPGARLFTFMPNSERLEQWLAICPVSGLAFHPGQRVQNFDRLSLEDQLRGQGFIPEAMFEVELSEQGFSACNNLSQRLAEEAHLHIGSGETLVSLAKWDEAAAADGAAAAEQGQRLDISAGRRWLNLYRSAARTSAASALLSGEPLAWGRPLISAFWDRIANSPLNALSFGRADGEAFVATAGAWLVPGGRHLDLGAGEGHIAELLIDAGFPTAILEDARERLNEITSRLRGRQGFLGIVEGRSAELAGCFDVVLATEVIEHVSPEDMESFFASIDRALCPGGRLLLTTPNAESLAESLVLSPAGAGVFHRWQHLHSFDRTSLANLAARFGFVPEALHEVDFSAATRGASPFIGLATAVAGETRVGNGSRLFAVFHRAGEKPAHPPTPRSMHPSAQKKMPPMTRASLLKWAAQYAFNVTVHIGRKALPRAVKKRLAPHVRHAENMIIGDTRVRFEARSTPLVDLPPLLDPNDCADGPIVLCNNALAWGGAERQVVNTITGLSARTTVPTALLCLRLGYDTDHDFYLSAVRDLGENIRNTMAIGAARSILLTYGKERLASIGAAIAWLPDDIQEAIFRLAADFVSLRPRVVHGWQDEMSIAAGYAARIAGVPRVIISGRNMAPVHFPYHRPYMADAYRELAACPRVVMLNNSAAGAADYALWLGISPARFKVLRNGVDPAALSSPAPETVAALRNALLIPPDAPVVGSIFRFYPEKRPLLWIDAALALAQERPECHFLVFGVGPLKQAVEARARAAGVADRLHCPGTIEQPAVGLAAMDVVLLTSEFEGTPNVVLEASLLGVPVVAAAAGGTGETILAGITGDVVDEPTPQTLARAAIRWLDDAGARTKVREAGPAFVRERFGYERMLDETIAVYGDASDIRAGGDQIARAYV